METYLKLVMCCLVGCALGKNHLDCKVSELGSVSQVGDCNLTTPAVQTGCSGKCSSASITDPTNDPLATYIGCECCQATVTSQATVDMDCPPGYPYTMSATCDNSMKVYFNDVLQSAPDSELGDWTKTSTFTVPADTRSIGIECDDAGGWAGILASFSNGLVTDGNWDCSTAAAGGGSPATEIGLNGDRPWGTRPGISDKAHWIWTPNFRNGDTKVFCRIDVGPTVNVGMTATGDNEMRVHFDGVEQFDPNTDPNDWRVSSNFDVPEGTQVVGIECHDLHVIGGILASFSNGVVTDGSWYCSAEDTAGWATAAFDPTTASSWAPAVVIGANGVSPWGAKPGNAGIRLDANWIWTANYITNEGGDTTVYCRTTLDWQDVFTYTVIEECGCGRCGDSSFDLADIQFPGSSEKSGESSAKSTKSSSRSKESSSESKESSSESKEASPEKTVKDEIGKDTKSKKGKSPKK